MSQQLVAKFVADADTLHAIVRGLTREQLVSFPVPGTWSLQQLVAHVLDSDLIAVHRMKRIIAEELPLLISYDETAFALRLNYQELDTVTVCDLFRLNRVHMGEILRHLPDATFERCGVHNQRGKVSLREMLEMYVHHVEHHLKFAREKRTRLGKPMNP